MPANEKQRYVMTSDLRQYMAEYIPLQMFDVIQSDVALHTRVHYNYILTTANFSEALFNV